MRASRTQGKALKGGKDKKGENPEENEQPVCKSQGQPGIDAKKNDAPNKELVIRWKRERRIAGTNEDPGKNSMET